MLQFLELYLIYKIYKYEIHVNELESSQCVLKTRSKDVNINNAKIL